MCLFHDIHLTYLTRWSDGAITSLFIAAMFNQNIIKTVLHAGNAYFSNEDIEMINQVADVSKWSARMRKPMEDVYGVDYFPKLWSEWINGIMAIANSSSDKNICRELLPKIKCPTLVIHGNKDAMVAPEHPEYLHKNIKNSSLVLFPDGKHNLHFKYKDRFNDIVEQFLIKDVKHLSK